MRARPSRRPPTVSRRGFTLVEIMIVVLIIGVLASIAVPNFIKARQSSRISTCTANLKRIETAKEQWILENRANAGDTVTPTDLAPVYIKKFPTCPEAGTYDVKPVGQDPTCSVAEHHL